jgi:hypothetical protein
MEELVPFLGTGMTSRAVSWRTRLLVAAEAPLVEGSLQARLVKMIEVDVALHLGEIFGTEPFIRMAVAAGWRLGLLAGGVTAFAVFIHQGGPDGMVMASGTFFLAEQLDMHGMIEFHGFVVLGYGIQDYRVRTLGVRSRHRDPCRQQEYRYPAYHLHSSRHLGFSFVKVLEKLCASFRLNPDFPVDLGNVRQPFTYFSDVAVDVLFCTCSFSARAEKLFREIGTDVPEPFRLKLVNGLKCVLSAV